MKTKTQHTPGPWEFVPHAFNHTCEIRDAHGTFGTVHRDNARLIASAPELLEALQGAERALALIYDTAARRKSVIRMHHDSGYSLRAFASAAQNNIHNAIAKARGE